MLLKWNTDALKLGTALISVVLVAEKLRKHKNLFPISVGKIDSYLLGTA